MVQSAQSSVRLTPALQAEYQQIYNDPAQKGSPAWQVAAAGLLAAGLIQGPTEGDLRDAIVGAEADTSQQTL